MLPRRFNTLGTSLDAELRAFLAFVVAKALHRPPHTLPPMTDAQLWQSFKLAATKINPYADTPPAITDPLNPGDFYAIEAGRELNTSAYPEGDDLQDIAAKAKTLAPVQAETMPDTLLQDCALTVLFLGIVPKILQALKHPKTDTFKPYEPAREITDEEFEEFEALCLTGIKEINKQKTAGRWEWPVDSA